MFLSNVRDSTEVIEMGLKSHGCDGLLTFGTGVIVAIFHCLGTTPSVIDWLNSWAIGAANIGAPSRKNQAGIPTRNGSIRHSIGIADQPLSGIITVHRVDFIALGLRVAMKKMVFKLLVFIILLWFMHLYLFDNISRVSDVKSYVV